MASYDHRLLLDAVVSRLGTQTSKNIGDGKAPSNQTFPYAVVYGRGEDLDRERDGTLSDPHDSTFAEFQVTSVGTTQDQALWMAKKSRDALLGWTPTVTGFTLGLVELALSLPTQRDDDAQPPNFYAVDEYRVFITD